MTKFQLIKKDSLINYFHKNYLFIMLFTVMIVNDFVLRFIAFEADFSLVHVVGTFFVMLISLIIFLIIPLKFQKVGVFILMYAFTTIVVFNLIYYEYFGNFLTLGLSSQVGILKDVSSSVAKIFKVKVLFLYVTPILFHFYYLKNKGKINVVPIQKKLKTGLTILLTIVLISTSSFLLLNDSQKSRIAKLWNRESVVRNFGIFTYQFADLANVVYVNLLGWGISEEETKVLANKYFENVPNIDTEQFGDLANRDVYFIHYESAQTFPIGEKINGSEITPFFNKLLKQGIYFDNMYAQESYGTSSDTEYTVSTSLLPLSRGSVFTSAPTNHFDTFEKLLKDKSYEIYAFHGNKGVFWRRKEVLENMGYDYFYALEDYEYDNNDLLGVDGLLGLSDEAFYEKTAEILAEKKKGGNPIYAKLITLSNHHPFESAAELSDLETGNIDDKELKNYLKSYNYADKSLEIFFTSMDKYNLLDNAIVVIYGDHDARLYNDSYEYFENFDLENNVSVNESSSEYKKLDSYDIQQYKRVPLLIWTKDGYMSGTKISQETGTIDISPTINTLLGVYKENQLGINAFDKRMQPLVFPNGSWIINGTYYHAGKNIFYGNDVTEDDFDNFNDYAQDLIDLSTGIIINDLSLEKD